MVAYSVGLCNHGAKGSSFFPTDPPLSCVSVPRVAVVCRSYFRMEEIKCLRGDERKHGFFYFLNFQRLSGRLRVNRIVLLVS